MGTSKLIKIKHYWQFCNFYTLYHSELAPERRGCLSDEEILWLKNACAGPRSTKPGCQTCTKNAGAGPRVNPSSLNIVLFVLGSDWRSQTRFDHLFDSILVDTTTGLADDLSFLDDSTSSSIYFHIRPPLLPKPRLPLTCPASRRLTSPSPWQRRNEETQTNHERSSCGNTEWCGNDGCPQRRCTGWEAPPSSRGEPKGALWALPELNWLIICLSRGIVVILYLFRWRPILLFLILNSMK